MPQHAQDTGGTRTSGARYSGVPQKVFMVAPSLMPSLHSPKSVILMCPSLSSMRFSSCAGRPRVSVAKPHPGPRQPGAHLEVAVHHVLLGVQVVQGRHDLSAIEASPVLGEHPLAGQVEEELREGSLRGRGGSAPPQGQAGAPGQAVLPNTALPGWDVRGSQRDGHHPRGRATVKLGTPDSQATHPPFAGPSPCPTSPPLAYSMTKQRRSWVWKEYFKA